LKKIKIKSDYTQPNNLMRQLKVKPPQTLLRNCAKEATQKAKQLRKKVNIVAARNARHEYNTSCCLGAMAFRREALLASNVSISALSVALFSSKVAIFEAAACSLSNSSRTFVRIAKRKGNDKEKKIKKEVTEKEEHRLRLRQHETKNIFQLLRTSMHAK
jgi:hypothetical protein